MSRLSLSLPATNADLSLLRTTLRDFLINLDEPPDDWLLMATELVTNAVAASPDDASVDVEVEASPERVHLRVVDMGAGFQLEPRASIDIGQHRGRGLMMVNALADELSVETEAGRTTLHASRQRTSADDGVRRVDVAVIGLGSAGEELARTLARAGRKVVGFERHRVGGECPFVACMPSKSLLVDAHAARNSIDLDARWRAAIERRDGIVNDRDDREHLEGLTAEGVEVVRATARLTGPRCVEANGVTWRADHVVLATGSQPIFPDIDGLDPTQAWSPFDALAEPSLPDRIGIIGAGPVGCELADVYQSFGSEVTLVDHSDRLLPDHDAEVAHAFESAIRATGIDLHLGVEVRAIVHDEQQDTMIFSGVDGEVSVDVDRIIVASGQAPRLADVGLEHIGLDADDPPELDDHKRVHAKPWLSVIGDLNGENPWTHGANRDAALLAAAIQGSPWARTASAMPRATFTEPKAAHVGCSATEHHPLIRGTATYGDVARSSTDELAEGLVVVSVDPVDGLIVGCSVVGPLADELIATATSLVHFEIPIERATTQVFAFPTISQVLEVAIADAAEEYAARSSV